MCNREVCSRLVARNNAGCSSCSKSCRGSRCRGARVQVEKVLLAGSNAASAVLCSCVVWQAESKAVVQLKKVEF